MKKIDAHAHIGYIGGWANVGINEEELIRQMDEFEIERTALCCEDNRITADVMNAHPDRIIGCIYVNPLNPATVDTMEEYAAKGFSAVKLNPLRHAYCADGDVLYPVMEKAGELGLPVCIHSGHPPYSLPWQIGLLAEKYPDVKIMMIHMGHGHGVYIDAALKMARKYPNIYLEMSGMPMPSKIGSLPNGGKRQDNVRDRHPFSSPKGGTYESPSQRRGREGAAKDPLRQRKRFF